MEVIFVECEEHNQQGGPAVTYLASVWWLKAISHWMSRDTAGGISS